MSASPVPTVEADLNEAGDSLCKKGKPVVLENMPTISHPELFNKIMAALYEKKINADVRFLVNGKEFLAHRAILAVLSPVFDKMLLDKSFKEANNIDEAVEQPKKSAVTFELLLKYIYSCYLKLDGLELDTVIDLLLMANEYQVYDLYSALNKTLQNFLSLGSVNSIFQAALLLDDSNLLAPCRGFYFDNAVDILQSSQFCELPKNLLIDLISHDSFFAPEIEILQGICRWYDANKAAVDNISDVLENVRMGLVRFDDMTLAKIVPVYELLASHHIDLTLVGSCSSSVNGRQPTYELKNLAITGSVQTEPNQSSYLFSQSCPGDYLSRNSPIIVCFPKVCSIASMAFCISANSNSFGCPFKVDTSCDKTEWNLLAERKSGNCLDRHLLMFRPRTMRYVKITSPSASGCNYYSVFSFECPAVSISLEDRTRYHRLCPTGGTLLFQKDIATVVLPANK